MRWNTPRAPWRNASTTTVGLCVSVNSTQGISGARACNSFKTRKPAVGPSWSAVLIRATFGLYLTTASTSALLVTATSRTQKHVSLLSRAEHSSSHPICVLSDTSTVTGKDRGAVATDAIFLTLSQANAMAWIQIARGSGHMATENAALGLITSAHWRPIATKNHDAGRNLIVCNELR